MKPELSILITSYKNPALLKLCINSIKANTKAIDYEIIVADSNTEEPTRDMMRENFSKVKFLPNLKNIGFGRSVNQMLEVAQSDFFFIINADIIIKDSSIGDLLAYIKSRPDVGIVGPQLINFDNTVQQSCFKFYSPLTVLYRRTLLGKFKFAKNHLEEFMLMKQQKMEEAIDVDWIMGSAMMVRAKAASEVGKFDSRYFMYFEDVDWCRRFWEKDFKVVYNPRIKVFHYHGKASASKNVLNSIFFNKYARIHIVSGVKFFLKFAGKKNPHKKSKAK